MPATSSVTVFFYSEDGEFLYSTAVDKGTRADFVGITPEQVNLNTVIEFENEMGEFKSFATMLLRVVNEMFNSFYS